MSDIVSKIIEGDQGGEVLEICDENGVGSGMPASRKDVHKKGFWHRAIIVAIVNNENKILIQKRSKSKEKFPGLWDLSIAGHIPYGADSLSCAAMEVMEELGSMIPKGVKVKEFRFMTSFRNQISLSDTFIENQFYDFFIYNVDLPIESFQLQQSEVEEVRYVTAYEIKTMAEQGLFHPRTEWIDILYKYITKF